ncbi:MAG: WYL domain-containing protein [Clostridia bacterium]|nr:WYL domain-containing protein [Clostridia bacterium]
MTLFSELYGAYYTAVAEIIREAQQGEITDTRIREICTQYAFPESHMTILPAIREQKWQLIRRDGTTPIQNPPAMPMTTLEKRWLKAILLDPRVRLFGLSLTGLDDVTPLFTPEDIVVYDRYADGDPYEEEAYIKNFRVILSAVRTKTPLKLTYRTQKTRDVTLLLMPEYLEYSEKDDKFRLAASSAKYNSMINLAKVTSVRPDPEADFVPKTREMPEKPWFTMILTNERNALDRVLHHFAHFEKRAERISGDKYRITVSYDRWDESELVIRVLSFGPMVKVTAPAKFVALIKNKLTDQYNLMHP